MKKNILLLLVSSLFSLSTYAANLIVVSPNHGQKTAKLKSVGIRATNGKFSILLSSHKTNYDVSYACNFNGKLLRNTGTMDLYKEIKANINNSKYSVLCRSTNNATGGNGHYVVFIGTHSSDAITVKAFN